MKLLLQFIHLIDFGPLLIIIDRKVNIAHTSLIILTYSITSYQVNG